MQRGRAANDRNKGGGNHGYGFQFSSHEVRGGRDGRSSIDIDDTCGGGPSSQALPQSSGSRREASPPADRGPLLTRRKFSPGVRLFGVHPVGLLGARGVAAPLLASSVRTRSAQASPTCVAPEQPQDRRPRVPQDHERACGSRRHLRRKGKVHLLDHIVGGASAFSLRFLLGAALGCGNSSTGDDAPQALTSENRQVTLDLVGGHIRLELVPLGALVAKQVLKNLLPERVGYEV
jgi:hypothetical protein